MPEKPWYTRWWAYPLYTIFALFLFSSIIAEQMNKPDIVAPAAPPSVSVTQTPEEPPETATPTPTKTA